MGYFRRKSGVLRSNKSYTKYNRVKYVRGIKQPNDKMGRYAKPPTLQKVIQLINSKVSTVVENKKSANFEFDDHIVKWSTAQNPVWYGTGTLYNTIFDISNGAGEFERIGNKYKLKKWMIKGFIYPSILGNNSPSGSCSENSFQGKVTVFLGKRVNGDRTTGQLEQLWQNGNTNIDPVGTVKEQIYHVNDDKYKIYWKRSYNMGPSTPNYNNYNISGNDPGDPVAALSVNMYSNNDLKLHAQFTIDITKYIGKNATIKFNDNNIAAQIPAPMQGLALFAVFSPFVGDLAASATPNSFYKIWSNTFFEYEDA